MATKEDKKCTVEPRPEGEGWHRAYAYDWERVVERNPCPYCGCTEQIESTHSWPYCANCKAV